MSFSKPQVSFSTNFASVFSAMKELLSAFLDQTLYTLQKGNKSKWKFWEFPVPRSKLTNFFVIFETTNQFLFEFGSLFGVITHKSSKVFSWNFTYFQLKEPIKVQIWWNFTKAIESLKFCSLMGFAFIHVDGIFPFCQNHIGF